MRRASQDDERRSRFEAIFDETYEPLLAYARRRAPADADDVVAETYAVAWRRLDNVPGDPLPWLYAVARRVLSEERRAGRRREALLERMWNEVRHDGMSFARSSESAVLAALARLDARDQEAILLVAWEGLSAERAAKAMGGSTAAFRVRLHRARKRLRARLEHSEDAASGDGSTSLLVGEARSR